MPDGGRRRSRPTCSSRQAHRQQQGVMRWDREAAQCILSERDPVAGCAANCSSGSMPAEMPRTHSVLYHRQRSRVELSCCQSLHNTGTGALQLTRVLSCYKRLQWPSAYLCVGNQGGYTPSRLATHNSVESTGLPEARLNLTNATPDTIISQGAQRPDLPVLRAERASSSSNKRVLCCCSSVTSAALLPRRRVPLLLLRYPLHKQQQQEGRRIESGGCQSNT